MTEIRISDQLRIPYGNMAFLSEVGQPRLYDVCVQLEQTLKQDYDTFAYLYRRGLEEFALCEETKRRIIASGMRYNEQTTRERITQEVKRSDNAYTDIIVDLCLDCDHSDEIAKLLKKTYSFPAAWNQNVFIEELETHIRSLFRFGSQNAHSGEKRWDLIPTYDLCKDYFRKIYQLLSAYYGNMKKFDGGKLPFGDYYPIPRQVCKEHGVELPEGKYLFLRIGEQGVSFYLFTSADSKLSAAQKRDIETIHRLWADNVDYPQNVVNQATFASNKNGKDFRYWIYPLPSFPHSLTDGYIASLSTEERLQIIRGIIRGVASMHKAEPPFYHRSLAPSAFLVCRVKGRYKPLLINFDCVKDTDPEAEYSVYYAVSDKLAKAQHPELIFAPELLEEDEIGNDAEIDWEKVDIFALGKTILKILTNSYEFTQKCPDGVSKSRYDLLQSICSDSPKLRPDIVIVEKTFI